MDAVWQTPRNGATGNGLLIEMPDVEVKSDNVSGPPQSVIFKFVSFQNGDAALLPEIGGGFFAEQLEQTVLDALHLRSPGALGTLRATGRSRRRDRRRSVSRRRRRWAARRLLEKVIAFLQIPPEAAPC